MTHLALLQLAGNQSALNPQGPAAASIARMAWIVMWSAAGIEVVTMLVLLLALYRGSRRRFLSHQASVGVVVVGGLVIPSITLFAFLLYSALLSHGVQASPAETDLRIILYGRQWWWEARYQQGGRVVAYTANELHIPVGQPVLVELQAPDVIHSFWVPNLTGKTDMIPGRANRQVLQADRAGVYRGQCAEFCGAQHAHMGFEVIAEEPAKFAAWLAWQGQPALEPKSEAERRGREAFVRGPCALCHTINGTEALGKTGPDLTHVAGRRTIAAATLPMNRGNLGGWIVDSQSMKPGNRMPRMNLPSGQLQDLMAYLETLQ